MKSKLKFTIVILCLCATLGVLTACSSHSTQTNADTATSIEIENGIISYTPNLLTVSLDSNPTTGYTWKASVEGDAVKLSHENFSSAENSNEEPIAGEGGVQSFEFTPTNAGISTLTFTYQREWEGAEKDATTLSINVTVENNEITSVSAE